MGLMRVGLVAVAVMMVAACRPDAVTAPSPVQEPLIGSAPPISPEMRLRDVLAGRVAGVTARSGGGARIHVTRGEFAPIPLERQPLFVLDGVPLPSQEAFAAAGIHPTDIMEIHLVKGPTAVLTYGDRARNGAVLITTRRAR
jgi:iron complex outermembrane receptor protein